MKPPHDAVMFLVSHSAAGGAQELWADLAQGFAAQGTPATLAALYPAQDATAPDSAVPWTYIVPRKPASLAEGWRLLRALVKFCTQHRPRMVFTALPAANVLAPLAATLANSRTRVTISHHTPVGTHNRLLNFLDGFTGSLACTRTVVSVSNAVAVSLQHKSPFYRRKRLTIRNALTPRVEQQLAQLAQSRDANRASARRVVALGRLSAQKNLPVLLQAAVHLHDVQIVLVGAGPDEGALRALAQALGVADRIEFLGHQPRQQALDVLAGASVFVQPSLYEGHSLALLEAAKLRLPLVVSDVPAQLEGVTRSDGTRCGIVVGVHDARGLADAVRTLLDSPAAYQRYAELSRSLAEDATFERMLGNYLQLACDQGRKVRGGH